MTIDVNGIKAVVTRKRIKNMRLSVRLKDGSVRVSAPFSYSEAAIKEFLSDKYLWIVKQLKRYQDRAAAEDFRDGGFVKLFGEKYGLTIRLGVKSEISVSGGRVTVSGKDNDTCKRIFEGYLKKRLTEEIDKKLPAWERATGLKSSVYIIRNMKTRWGTCNTVTKKLTFNLQLVKRPSECLDYLIVHELGHIRYKGHGKDFKEYLTFHIPDWKRRRKLLKEDLLQV